VIYCYMILLHPYQRVKRFKTYHTNQDLLTIRLSTRARTTNWSY